MIKGKIRFSLAFIKGRFSLRRKNAPCRYRFSKTLNQVKYETSRVCLHRQKHSLEPGNSAQQLKKLIIKSGDGVKWHNRRWAWTIVGKSQLSCSHRLEPPAVVTAPGLLERQESRTSLQEPLSRRTGVCQWLLNMFSTDVVVTPTGTLWEPVGCRLIVRRGHGVATYCGRK